MKKNTIQEVLNGSVFTHGWFKRQTKLFLMIAALAFVYIYLGLYSAQQQRHYSKMKEQLKNSEYELLTLRSSLTDLTRQSSVSRELLRRGSRLSENEKAVKRIR